VLEDPGDKISAVLNEFNSDPGELKELLLSALVVADQAQANTPAGRPNREDESKTPFLDRYGSDLTAKAREGKLGPVIGRRTELLSILQTLARHRKNNPVLVGEAGVGKTAIVEALAQRVIEGKDAGILSGKRIIELNIGTLVAGTKYRGEFEERLTGILKEASEVPEIILFIDEIHNVVGAGDAAGSLDAANILKPALARGDLRCIGATTTAEYRRYIESDAALERRFEKIIINEPESHEALEILKGLRPNWEKHHGVHISDEALADAVELSLRFDMDHRLPDKAIDLVDKAGARCKVPQLSIGPHVDPERVKSVGEVNTRIIAEILAEKTGLPVELILGHRAESKHSRILGLEAYLKERLIGQDSAVEQVCRHIIMAHSGLAVRRGPLAVYLFMGPTGVGKTELARLLAEYLFGSIKTLIRLDMSEYMEEHSAAKLIGSPPGYVGYEEEGQLTGNLRSKPYSIILLDEVEKAHPRIFDLFLQLFDEGRLTDAKGRIANAKNAIFIMTSNITVARQKQLGFNIGDEDAISNNTGIKEALHNRFRPEFINRIDEQVLFRSLNEKDSAKIIKIQVDALTANLKSKYGVTLIISPEAMAFVLEKGYKPEYGARELTRAIDKNIQMPLSRLIADGKLTEHTVWNVTHDSGNLVFLPVLKE
jgi:ATP-dependent Clp protease ATP-binding subunit ClpC